MSYNAKVYNVMIASPGDVVQERQCIRDVIYEWNAIHSQTKPIVLLPIGWETHASPEMGRHPQEIINSQVLEKSDILVGVFWSRIGTPTEESISGSVEEIETHIKSGKLTMLYFSKKDIPQASIDHEQLSVLRRFKESCIKRGLFSEYNDVTHLRDLFRSHLQLKTNSLMGYQPNSGNPPGETQNLMNIPIISAVNSYPSSLTYEEGIMLKALSVDDNAYVAKIQGLGINGYAMGISSARVSINFNKSNTLRESSKWSGCLDSLVSKGLLQTNDTREMYTLTDKGYNLADRIEREFLDEFLAKEVTHRTTSLNE